MSIITSGIKKLIENNAMALATISKNGQPHNIAVAYCKVFGDKVIISNSHVKETINNLENNKQVSLVVWHKDWETICIGFELKGVAENIKKGKWFDFVCDLPDNEGYDIKSAIAVKILKIKKLLS